jgi:hypothetical protein
LYLCGGVRHRPSDCLPTKARPIYPCPPRPFFFPPISFRFVCKPSPTLKKGTILMADSTKPRRLHISHQSLSRSQGMGGTCEIIVYWIDEVCLLSTFRSLAPPCVSYVGVCWNLHYIRVETGGGGGGGEYVEKGWADDGWVVVRRSRKQSVYICLGIHTTHYTYRHIHKHVQTTLLTTRIYIDIHTHIPQTYTIYSVHTHTLPFIVAHKW